MKRRVHLSESLTAEQVAQLLGCEPETVYRYASKGELTGWKLGRLWRFTPEAVQAFIRSREVKPAPSSAPSMRERVRPLLDLPGADRFVS